MPGSCSFVGMFVTSHMDPSSGRMCWHLFPCSMDPSYLTILQAKLTDVFISVSKTITSNVIVMEHFLSNSWSQHVQISYLLL